ncbi:glutamine synthetase family protein [Arthrobacter sp. UM1]|uniref:glutamine synthetase family protein n=1 Tax=Arthrobacter sp. UM1 TaxID=2766776 RepID=UPI001CF6A331|nr:glutamine synthetase family protein [Arthrobacter sp. UM1]MCB4208948.1 glutamine synthetase [Arthrobacter sp. UM1]
MARQELAFIATNDLAAQTRGRSMLVDEVDLETGCGWVPANLGIGPFGKIVETSGFGSTGDLRLVPDERSRLVVDGVPNRPRMHLYMADIKNTDGSEWPCCPRTFLRRAVQDFTEETGLTLLCSFEHEFMLRSEESPEPPFSLQAFRRMEPFGTDLVNMLQSSGLRPETWLPEYGEHQWEVTMRPEDALTAADRAVALRDLVRDFAHSVGRDATFAPLLDPEGTGNGVHIHFSFLDRDGKPVMHDPSRSGEISELTGSFAAGVLRHASALAAIAAPSDVSYLRLAPHRWSSANAFLGRHNREAFLRICPTVSMEGRDPASQLNLEFRAGDGTGNPWLVLGSLIRAGLEGVREKLAAPTVVDCDVEEMDESERESADIRPLPRSLEEALTALEQDTTAAGWFHPDLLRVHTSIKRDEIDQLRDFSSTEKCERYARAY